MCGISAIAGAYEPSEILAMMSVQEHRGPDYSEAKYYPACGLGHNRLKVIDLSDAANQPMTRGNLTIVFNGEIYNYREIKAELADSTFTTESDTEVILAAWEKWGWDCLDKFIGMWAFVIWDSEKQELCAARDRFGVKPLYYHWQPGRRLMLASEIKAIHAAGVQRAADDIAWATYLATGVSDSNVRTFWKGICQLPGGCGLRYSVQDGLLHTYRWYKMVEACKGVDLRPDEAVMDEYQALMQDAIRLRFRSDVKVGINLSGGVDSSALFAIASTNFTPDLTAYTFVTHSKYDELKYVQAMMHGTHVNLVTAGLSAAKVERLAQDVQDHTDEPYGGIPTLAYAYLFEAARKDGTIVLLDGNGMDEQWAGYDYYAFDNPGMVQGVKEPAFREDCLIPDFAWLQDRFPYWLPMGEKLRNYQYRDIVHTKLPRNLRFNDRISARVGTELRSPFLDHRLIELAMRQPDIRKIDGKTHKAMLRKIVARITPEGIAYAPKRPVQTPQREWLRGPLRKWANERIEDAINRRPEWLNGDKVRGAWAVFQNGGSDCSTYIWQWITISLMGI